MFVGLVWLTSNHMFGWDKSPSLFFKIFEIALVLLRQFQNFQKRTRAIYPKSPNQTRAY